MAIEWVKFGRPPYLGSADQNLPGIAAINLVSVALFGRSAFAYQLVDAIVLLIASLVLYRIWLHWLKPRASFIAVLLFDFYLIRGGTFILGQRDVYAGVLILAAAVAALRSDRNLSLSAAISGILIGVAILIRPTYLLYAPIIPLAIPALRSSRPLALLGALSILPLLLLLIGYSTIPGALSEVFSMTVLANMDLYTKFGAPFLWFALNAIYVPIFIVGPALGFVVWKQIRAGSADSVQRPISRQVTILFVGYVVLTLVLILIQRKFLPYHFAPYVLLLTPLAALAIEAMTSRFSARVRLASVIVAGIFFCWPIRPLYMATTEAITGHSNFIDGFRNRMDPDPGVGYLARKNALDYLNSPARRTKSVEVIGFDARLRALLARWSPTRFTQIHLIGYRIDPQAPESEAEHPEYQRRWRKEFVDSLQNADMIVVARKTHSWYLKDPVDVLHSLPGFDSLLSADFRPDTTIGSFEIYERK